MDLGKATDQQLVLELTRRLIKYNFLPEDNDDPEQEFYHTIDDNSINWGCGVGCYWLSADFVFDEAGNLIRYGLNN